VLVAILSVLVLLAGCGEETLQWTEADGYRWAALDPSGGEAAGFTPLSASETGISFENKVAPEQVARNRHYVNGSGVAVGDVTGNGRPDIYLARLNGPNALYANRGGFQFENIADSAGVALPDQFSTGATLADLTGDGTLDLLVTTMGGPNRAFANDGGGRFTEITDRVGLEAGRGSTTMALADIDGDGDLDLFVGNYKDRSIKDEYPPDVRAFERVVVQENGTYRIKDQFQGEYRLRRKGNQLARIEVAEPNRLYINEGDGHFRRASFTDGRFRHADGTPLQEAPKDWTLMVRFQDVNGDGAPDLYVCNDFISPDRFWINDGSGHFRAIDSTAVRKTSNATMSVAFTDLQRDGHLDFFLADMMPRTYEAQKQQIGLRDPLPPEIGAIETRPQVKRNTLFLNRGDGTYAEIGELGGVKASGWTWSSQFTDVDLDGYDDLLLTTGHAYNPLHAETQVRLNRSGRSEWRRKHLEYPRHTLKNDAFRNEGDWTFERVEDGWGLGVEADIAHGMALADFDRDGDRDVVLNRLGKPAQVYRNDAAGARIAVRLRGSAPNTHGIGAQIRVETAGLPAQTQEVVRGGAYLSSSEAAYTFAAQRDEPLTITVRWPDGTEQIIEEARPNRIYEIRKPGHADASTADVPTADARPDAGEEASGRSGRRVVQAGSG
jgi:hypothetical protein